ncbi:MAG: hypothetical protein HC805_04295 [Alkalinema sp. RL_2_19]|nr:hypothetical protein [Alkalinema sp. RL_2_19]
MTNDRLKIELLIDANHPDLLRGLEEWLRLGLISDRQVKLLARNELCSKLPESITTDRAAANASTNAAATLPQTPAQTSPQPPQSALPLVAKRLTNRHPKPRRAGLARTTPPGIYG